jgi:hypothetical protein
MTCPGCGSQVTMGSPMAVCASCGFPIGRLRMALAQTYVITFALFMSIVTYGVIVALVHPGGSAQIEGDVVQAAPYVALAVAAGLFILMLRWGEVPGEMAPQAAVQQVVLHAALAEVPAVLGLVAYFLTGKTQDFVIPLVGSLVLFATLATRVPKIGMAIRRYLYREWEESRRR